MQRLDEVPRHTRQQDFEATFCLGPREVLLKTYSCNIVLETLQFSLGKMWISTSAISFSGGNKRLAVHLDEILQIKDGGFLTIDIVLADSSKLAVSGLWHKDECMAYLTSMWLNNRTTTRSRASSLVGPTVEVDDMVLIGSPRTSRAERLRPMSPSSLAIETLDELDEVADLMLLLPSVSAPPSPVGVARSDETCDQYLFPIEPDFVERYKEFMVYYVRHQGKMRAKWLKFLQKGDEMMQPQNREELVSLLLGGLPPELRPSVYFRISGAREMRSKASRGYYERMSIEAERRALSHEWGRAIEKDLTRTYPYHPSFDPKYGETVPQMRRILFAYGLRSHGTVGYCQGMNFVCGALLIQFRNIRDEAEREEKVFWVLCAIVERLLPAYYTGDMIGSMVDQSVLAIYCEKRMPRLYQKFGELEYPISLVLCKWMNCIFWLNVPSETAARVMDVTMLLGSDALLEYSLGFLAAFQTVLCQCTDLSEISKLLDSSLTSFFPTALNSERMSSFVGQIDRRELVTLRHRVYERAEKRLREHSTARTLDRLRHLGSLEENELLAMEEHWADMFAAAPHKEGIDRETFVNAVARNLVPTWAGEPKLLGLLFEHCNKSRSGVVSLNEWATMIEWMSTKRGKMRLLYGLCGDKGEPARIAQVIALLSTCWRGREATRQELAEIEAETSYTPERFVKMLKSRFPEFLTSLEFTLDFDN